MKPSRSLLIPFLLVLIPTLAVAQVRNRPGGRTDEPAAVAKVESGTLSLDASLEGLLSFVVYGPGQTDVWTLGVAEGEVPGLGRSRLFTFQMPTPQGTVINGRFFLVAASGDQIIGKYEGTTTPGEVVDGVPHLIGHVTWNVTGGTGRFAKATGTADVWADVTFGGFAEDARWTIVWAVKGVVQY